ncbi:hypothetical protein PVL29_008382 [Vitis rotundifolia]|uniref:Uncharacterized protein n=2 Tax=Vitis rotundifolia TaxID=103349 RepID=A0AA38ZVK8_VITRO|nr:hypothetical protein PVL29_008382 [Vitis rotundifolia]
MDVLFLGSIKLCSSRIQSKVSLSVYGGLPQLGQLVCSTYTIIILGTFSNRTVVVVLRRGRMAFVVDTEQGATGPSLISYAMQGKWEKVVDTCKEDPWAHDEKTTTSGDTALHIAVSDGREDVVVKLVQLMAHRNVYLINIKNDRGNTPLHLAASVGNVRMCKCIAAEYPELVGVRNNENETPLFLAALHVYEYLRRSDGENSLHCAITGEYSVTLKRTWGMGKRKSPVLIAAENGIIEMVEKILILFPAAIRHVDADKKNIVLLAVKNRQTSVYELLLNRKPLEESAFRMVDSEGNSALHLAATLGDDRPYPFAALQMQWEIKWYKAIHLNLSENRLVPYIYLTIPIGVPSSICSKRTMEFTTEDTDLHTIKKSLFNYAMQGKWNEVVNICRQQPRAHKAEIVVSGDTALHVAVSEGKESIVEELVELIRETDLDALEIRNEQGNTPLHLAASMGNVPICKCLTGKHPKLVGVRNHENETPLFSAVLHGWKDAFLCLHKICDRTKQYEYGRRADGKTILHCAIFGEFLDLAFQIIYLYEDFVSSVDEEGFTPLHLLAGKPSAFKSGTHLSWISNIIYQCKTSQVKIMRAEWWLVRICFNPNGGFCSHKLRMELILRLY